MTNAKLQTMETDLPINHHLIIPGDELKITASRASGPGGQHVNKTSSRISLRWNLLNTTALNDREKDRVIKRLHHRLVGDGDILIHVDSERSQLQNRRIALERLAALIKDALHVQKKRVATKPSLGSHVRRIKGKKLRGIIKQQRRAVDE